MLNSIGVLFESIEQKEFFFFFLNFPLIQDMTSFSDNRFGKVSP